MLSFCLLLTRLGICNFWVCRQFPRYYMEQKTSIERTKGSCFFSPETYNTYQGMMASAISLRRTAKPNAAAKIPTARLYQVHQLNRSSVSAKFLYDDFPRMPERHCRHPLTRWRPLFHTRCNAGNDRRSISLFKQFSAMISLDYAPLLSIAVVYYFLEIKDPDQRLQSVLLC